jgi:hypothetical protein
MKGKDNEKQDAINDGYVSFGHVPNDVQLMEASFDGGRNVGCL